MIVKSTWILTIIIVVIALSTSSGNMIVDLTTSTESSFEYLRQVMLELRDLNPQPTQSVPTRETDSFRFDANENNYLPGKQHSTVKRIVQPPVSYPQSNNLGFRASIIQPTVAKKIEPIAVDQMIAETATNNRYYQLPDVGFHPSAQRVTSPEVPPLTRSELNAVYKHAIEKGSAVSLNALANVLRHRQLPTKITDHVEIGESQPLYTYHYYPLKHLMNDVRHGNMLPGIVPGMLPTLDLRPENTGLAQDSQKEVGNPLFMAISGFIGMAVLFMIGILLFPRLGDFGSRIVNEDEQFLDLSKTVDVALNREKCFDSLAHPYRSYHDERYRILCEPAETTKPSSVMLTSNSDLQKNTLKKRKKNSKKCKSTACKKSLEAVEPT